jgi:putative membrane protein
MARTPPLSNQRGSRAQQEKPPEPPAVEGGQAHQTEKRASASDYMANERTLLAWIRTGIALIALGFVVARFGLLLHQLSLQTQRPDVGLSGGHWSSIIGTVIVGLAAALLALSYLRYRAAAHALDRGTYHDSRSLAIGVVLAVIAIAVALAVYLLITS